MSPLRERNVVTCVFCGHEYPTGTPRAQHQALTDHVAVCDKHPAAAFRLRAEKAEEEAARLTSSLAASDDEIMRRVREIGNLIHKHHRETALLNMENEGLKKMVDDLQPRTFYTSGTNDTAYVPKISDISALQVRISLSEQELRSLRATSITFEALRNTDDATIREAARRIEFIEPSYQGRFTWKDYVAKLADVLEEKAKQ